MTAKNNLTYIFIRKTAHIFDMGSFLIFLMIVLLLIVPIYISTDLYFDVVSGKIGCQISLYKKIKLLGGYFTPCAGGFALHVSDKKARLFTYQQIEAGGRQLTFESGLKVTSIKCIAEIDPEYLFGVWVVDNLLKTALLFQRQMPILESAVYLKESGFRIFLRASLRFTLIAILQGLVKYLYRRVKGCQRRKSAT